MFFAALRSRSWRARQDGHRHARTRTGRSASRNPHAEHVLDEGYQRPITTRRRPARSHLYSSWRRNSPHPQSEMARARHRLRTMFFTTRSSIAIRSLPRISRWWSVQEVAAGVADLAVGPGNLGLRLSPVGRAALAAGQPPLIAGEVAGPPLQMPGVGDLLAVRHHEEAGHAKVDASRTAGRGQRLRLRSVDREGHIPAPVGLSRDDHHGGIEYAGVDLGPRPHEGQRPAALASRSSPSRIENADRV